jgi:hypothetical protein
MKAGQDFLGGVIVARTIGTGLDGAASAQLSDQESAAPRDLDGLARIDADDQGDRLPGESKPIDWSTVVPRDRARRPRQVGLLRRHGRRSRTNPKRES